MTVAFDAQLDLGSFTTTSPDDTTFTPVGTPRAIVVVIASTIVNTDVITGVTYGGVAMARVDTATAAGGGGDTFRSYMYFLGTGIPTGAQTVSITHTGSANTKWAAAFSLTAAADTEVGDFGTISAVQANPQIALDTGAATALRYSILVTGLPTPSDNTPLTDVLAVASSPRIDFGNNVAIAGRQTSAASSGSFTIGYTAASDDVAMVAAAVQELSTAVTGTIAVTQAAQVGALVGSLNISGTVAATQDPNVGAFVGTHTPPAVTGTIAVTQQAQTGAFTGTETLSGTIGATQDAQVAALTGTVANPITGIIGATQADNVGTFTGTAVTDGGWNSIQADQTGSFTGTVLNPVTGAIGATQQDQTGSFTGTHTPPAVTGTLGGVQADQVAVFVGDSTSPGVTGTIAAAQADQTGSFTGISATGIVGVIGSVQHDEAASFTGTVANQAGSIVGGSCVLGGPTAVCTMSPVVIVAGSNVQITTTFRDANGDLADPASIDAVVQAPDGTQTTPVPTSSSVGIWVTVIPTDQAGYWFYQITGTGSEIDVVCQGSFCAEASLILV